MVVIIILGTAIIVNIAKANIINNAKIAKLKNDIAMLNEEFKVYISEEFVNKNGKYDSRNLSANVAMAMYEEEFINDKNNDKKSDIYDILPSLSNSNLKNKIYIENGEFVFEGKFFDSKEIKVINDLGFKIHFETEEEIIKSPVIEYQYESTVITNSVIGIKVKVSLKYDDSNNIKNYYSVDGGVVWKEYTGETELITNGTIKAKSVKTNGEELETSVNIEISQDGIGPNAFDTKRNTGYDIPSSTLKGYLYIDKSAIGASINLYAFSNGSIDFVDENLEVIENIIGYNVSVDKSITIPQNAYAIKFSNSSTKYYTHVYEVSLDVEPNIIETGNKEYSKIYNEGIKIGCNNYIINYHESSVQKLYKIDDGEWKEYDGKEISIKYDSKLYAKGINELNIETEEIYITSKTPEDGIGPNAFDTKRNTGYDIPSSTLKGYLYIDESAIGASINLYAFSNGSIDFVDENLEVIENIIGYNVSVDKSITIPQNAYAIKFSNSSTKYYTHVYEVSMLN